MFTQPPPSEPTTSSSSQHYDAWTADLERPFSTGEALWWERIVRKGDAPRAPDTAPRLEEAHEERGREQEADPGAEVLLTPEVRRSVEEEIRATIERGLDEYWAEAESEGATALCLSGGGIRSAAFSLGVVQALAAKRLLTSFDYLSTVSGGGYLGGFLQRWALGDPNDGRNEAGLQEALAASISGSDLPEIARLRDGATFVTPQVGLFSNDSWTALATTLRNLFVNWLLFAPILMLAAAAPVAFYWLLMGASATQAWIALALHFAALVWAMAAIGSSLPTYRLHDYAPPTRIATHVLAPVLVACLCTAVVAAVPGLLPPSGDDGDAWRMWPIAASAATAPPVGLGLALLASLRSGALVGERIAADVILWTICGAAAAAGYLLLSTLAIGSGVAQIAEGGSAYPEWMLIAGPVAAMCGILAAGWLFSLLRTFGWRSAWLKADLDREWLARLSAIMLRPALLWLAFTLVTVLVVYLRPGEGNSAPSLAQSPLDLGAGSRLVSGGVASGLVAALVGRSSATKWLGYARRFLSLEVVATLATLVFAVLALTAAGRLDGDLAFRAHDILLDRLGVEPAWAMFWAHATLIAALGAFIAIYGRIVDVNRFSLNGFYRNRLTRAFLGAARCGCSFTSDLRRDARSPDEFTGFDPRDNVRLHTLWPAVRRDGRRPALFPVVNVSLNAVATRRLSWQERKALPFTLTPLACGSGWLGADPASPAGAFAPSNRYGGQENDQALEGNGVSLAAAMAISGAAASPNMGYHSSPATAFLMTLFNVRLGAWLPNPASWRGGRDNPVELPRNAAALLLRELAGRTDDVSPDIYLSDGGHFENLGVYEMVRRRCAFIVSVDGGCDPSLGFEDLGNAVRKIGIDLNVDISFDDFAIEAGGGIAHATATIHYPPAGNAPGWKGRLLYIKPHRLHDLPLDVRAYAASHSRFPHESTADQWYAESQFESYRSLGQHIAQSLGRDDYRRDGEGRPIPEGSARLAALLSDVAETSGAVENWASTATGKGFAGAEQPTAGAD